MTRSVDWQRPRTGHSFALQKFANAAARVIVKSSARSCFGMSAVVLATLLLGWSCTLADEVVIRHEDRELKLIGEILVTAQDNGILFLDVAGKLWLVQPDAILSRVDGDTRPQPLSKKEMAERVLGTLPTGFRTETTDHFVIAYNTERVYAKYIGGLYERLLRGFSNHWKTKRKWKLDEPTEPLVAIIFRNFAEYAAFVKRDIGIEPPQSMVAYYNIMTNQVVMYDLTSELGPAGQAVDSDRQILEILSSPNAQAMIMTIIHEGTHQLMCNLGMQRRLAATPLWVSEGLAMYFEPPDLSSNSGWRAIGQVNYVRLVTFRQNLAKGQRAANYFTEMLTSDQVFQTPEQLLDRYAEAWAFNYFLLNKHSAKYVDYLKFLSEKEPLIEDSPETRLAEFQRFFPMGLDKLEMEFLAFMRTVQ